MATKPPDTMDRIRRRARMDANNAKNTYPTSEGNRKSDLRKPPTSALVKKLLSSEGGRVVREANKFKDVTDKAAEGINARKKYKDVE